MISGVYTSLIRFIPLEYKLGLVPTIFNRCFSLSFEFLKFRHEVDKLERILSKNPCPQKIFCKYKQKFLKNMFIQKSKIAAVPKKERI